MHRRLGRLLLPIAVVALLSHGVSAGTYVRPSLIMKNTVEHVWPKCFYKYLAVELGQDGENWNVSLELNWLDDVDVMTAYRIAFPYVLQATWTPSGQDRLELAALTMNPSSGIENTSLAEARYTRSAAGPAGTKLDLSASLWVFPAEQTASLTPGAALSRRLGQADVVMALNGLDAKDYATLGRDRTVLSVGAAWAMYGDSRLAATLNTIVGPADPAVARTWLDLRFLFGSLYRN